MNNKDDHQASDRAYREKWIRALLASDRPTGQKLTGIALAWHMNMEPDNNWHRAAWVKAARIAQETDQVVSSTRGQLTKLSESGWLQKIGRTTEGRGACVYRFTIPTDARADNLTGRTKGVSSTTESESVAQLSQSKSYNVVSVSCTTESESVPGLTEYPKHSPDHPANEDTKESSDGDTTNLRLPYGSKTVEIAASSDGEKTTRHSAGARTEEHSGYGPVPRQIDWVAHVGSKAIPRNKTTKEIEDETLAYMNSDDCPPF